MKKVIYLITLIVLIIYPNLSYSNEKITVLLDWFINPDHAPLFIALEMGYFDENGLEVKFIAPTDPNDPPKLVAAGKADLAISYQPQLHIQVDQGLKLKRIGTIIATPLNSLVVLKDGPIKKISDLKGKKVGYSVGGFENAILGKMLSENGLSIEDIKLINVNFSLSPALISKNVDAVIGAFRNFELNQLSILGKEGKAFYVEEHGVPAYDELIIVAKSDNVEEEKFVKFMNAMEKGVQYLINNPNKSWKLFIKNRKNLDDELNRRAWKDTLPRFALRPGAFDKVRYKKFGEFLEKNKMIKKSLSAENYGLQIE